MSNILLIEPNYKCKQPPLGLMKISRFHKTVLHDYVRFTKGKLPKALSDTKWDKVYVTSLFTFEWKATIEAIEYAKTLVDSVDKISVGGIAATMMSEQIYEDTGIYPVCGLLNESGKLGIQGDECIDQMIPDYTMLEDIESLYPFNDAYFLSATKGCGNNCGFCAVQTLEPTFVPYMDIKNKISLIDEEFGPKRNLILMDNNVLRSPRFNQIIDDIIAAGFGKGATYKNPRTGKTVKRYVDFNQGLDAFFLNEDKAKRLGEIALKPARVAFDHIEDQEVYENALRLCAENGITELSNYVLYNSEDFGGKGQRYKSDTPEDLYDRMRKTLDLKDDINSNLPEGSEQVAAFSFPMRYIPLSANERGYVGSNWNAKYLRAVQCMLVPTQGKGVNSRSFFKAAFGDNSTDFVRFLCMPERLIANRGIISRSSRGNSKETEEEFAKRKAQWERAQKKIAIWNELFEELNDEREAFIDLIGDNQYLPEKVLGITSSLHKKLYMLYLTPMRLFKLLGIIDKKSPTYTMVYDFLTKKCRYLYLDILDGLVESEAQQKYVFTNFIHFFGRKGVSDLLDRMKPLDFAFDKQLSKWDIICKGNGVEYIDWELVRIYGRFVDLGVFSDRDHEAASTAISSMEMTALAKLLKNNLKRFEKRMSITLDEEQGQKVLKKVTESILDNIQVKLSDLLEVN
jgi:hypothetical protein